ncbi:MAG: hypothetical protein ACLU99_14925 [Alphaproteobacteria bacterium]
MKKTKKPLRLLTNVPRNNEFGDDSVLCRFIFAVVIRTGEIGGRTEPEFVRAVEWVIR